MRELLEDVFERLDRADVRYCLLRDGDRLDSGPCPAEVDLLVEEDRLGELRTVVRQLGFVEVPAWGRWPHRFFVAYREDRHRWLKLDVVTQVAFGRSSHRFRSSLADGCLNRRMRQASTYTPSPEDELVTLLLHCVLDKGFFSPSRRRRIGELSRLVTDRDYLAQLFDDHWSDRMTWAEVSAAIEVDTWASLLAERRQIEARLARPNRLAVRLQKVRDRVLRKADGYRGLLRPRALMVAVLAPDGAGKSTVIQAVEDSFFFSTRSIYMGLYQKRSEPTDRRSIPGTGLAKNLVKQWRQYARAKFHQIRGRLVLFDRYTYDAMLRPTEGIGMLRRWRLTLLAHTCPAPDLIVLLDAPGELLFSRKHEHTPAALEDQRQGYLALGKRLTNMVVVDATRDPEHVCREVTSVIWQGYASMLNRSYRE